MKMDDIQGKTQDELMEVLGFLKKERFNLRFQQATGELSNTARFRQVRRDIARIKTMLNAQKSKRKAA